MEDKNKFYDLAERIYDLDKKVYKTLGSDLGRVFPGKKKKCVNDMLSSMSQKKNTHILRSNMTLIGNMIRTIPNEKKKAPLLEEYLNILNEIEQLPTAFDAIDILDKEMASTSLDIDNRFGKDDHLIICISRTYGCSGSSIGFRLAEELNINYYDGEIFDKVLTRLDAQKGSVKDHFSFPHMFDKKTGKYLRRMPLLVKPYRSLKHLINDFNRYHGLPRRDAIFFNQSDLLVDMAAKEDFVVMGRCAETILRNNHIPHISIFISAPLEQRVNHVMALDETLTQKQATAIVKKQDKKHKEYYNFYSGKQWGIASNYDLTINSAVYGIQGCVDLIQRVCKKEDVNTILPPTPIEINDAD